MANEKASQIIADMKAKGMISANYTPAGTTQNTTAALSQQVQAMSREEFSAQMNAIAETKRAARAAALPEIRRQQQAAALQKADSSKVGEPVILSPSQQEYYRNRASDGRYTAYADKYSDLQMNEKVNASKGEGLDALKVLSGRTTSAVSPTVGPVQQSASKEWNGESTDYTKLITNDNAAVAWSAAAGNEWSALYTELSEVYGNGQWQSQETTDAFIEQAKAIKRVLQGVETYYTSDRTKVGTRDSIAHVIKQIDDMIAYLETAKATYGNFASAEEYAVTAERVNMTPEQLQNVMDDTYTMEQDAAQVEYLQEARDRVAISQQDDATVDATVAEYDRQIAAILGKYGYKLSGEFFNTDEVNGYVQDMRTRAETDRQTCAAILDKKTASKFDMMSSEELKAHIDAITAAEAEIRDLKTRKEQVNHELSAIPDRAKGAGKEKADALNAEYRELRDAIDKAEAAVPSAIAYTITDGTNVTWQMLYDQKVYQEEFDAMYRRLSANADWAAMSAYVADENATNQYEKVNAADETVYTDKEKQVYNYLYHTQGADAAKEWHEKNDTVFRQRKIDNSLTNIAAWVNERGWAGDLFLTAPLSVVANLTAPLEYIVDLGKSAFTGKMDRNYLSQVASTMRGTVNEKYDWMIGNKDAHDFLFNAGMSVAESGIAAAVPFGLGAIPLGMSAAASATNDALDRGMSSKQAIMNGIAAGVFEAVFESVSIGNFKALKESIAAGGKDIAKNIVKSVVTNLSEEAATEIANITYDTIMNGDFSYYETTIRQYMQAGMSEEEAKHEAAKVLGGQVGEAAMSGGVVGLILGGIGSVSSYHNSVATGNHVITSAQVENLVELGKTMPPESRAYILAEELENTTPTAAKVGALYAEIQTELSNMEDPEQIGRVSSALAEIALAPAVQSTATDAATTEQAVPNRDAQKATNDAQNAAEGDFAANVTEGVGEIKSDGVPKYGNAQTWSGKTYQNEVSTRLAQKINRRIELYDGSADMDAEYGFAENGVIYVNTAKGDVATTVVAHELTHTLEGTEEYRALSEYVLQSTAYQQYLQTQGLRSHESLVQRKVNTMRYVAQSKGALTSFDENAARTQALHEILADFVGNYLVRDEQHLADLARTKPRLFERLRQLVIAILNKFGLAENAAERIAIENRFRTAMNAAKAQQNPASGRGAEYMIVTMADGRKYVQATRQVIHGDDASLWENQIIDYVNDVVRNGEDLQIPTTNGDVLVIDGRTAWKLGYRNQNEDGAPISDDMYRTKGNASGHIDELAEVSNYKTWKPNYKKDRKREFAKDGFDYRIAYFRDFDGEYYKLWFSVGIDGGRKAVYNIGQIIKVPFPVSGSKAKTGTTPSNNKIPQNDPIVNTKSMQDQANYAEKSTSNTEFSVPDILSPRERALMEDNRYLREMVKLQGKVTHGNVFRRSSVLNNATKLMRDTGAKGNKSELAELLTTFYKHIASGKDLSWDGIMEAAEPVADWLVAHHFEAGTLSAETEEMLSDLKETPVKLSDTQKEEVCTAYDTYGAYRNAMRSLIEVADTAEMTLDERWQELCELYPERFDTDIVPEDMPLELARIADDIQKERNAADEEYRANVTEVREQYLEQIYDSYWDASTIKTVADRYEKQIEGMRAGHKRAMEKAQRQAAYYRDADGKLQDQYRKERDEGVKQVRERQKKTEMRQKIRREVARLNQLLLNKNRNSNVLLGLQKAVAAALNSVNMETYNYNRAMDNIEQDMAQARSEEELKYEYGRFEKTQKSRDAMRAEIEGLKKAYEAILHSNDNDNARKEFAENFKNEIEQVTLYITRVSQTVGNTPLYAMNFEQLELVHNMFSMIKEMVYNTKKIWRKQKAEDIDEWSEVAASEVLVHKKKKGVVQASFIKNIEEFDWNNLKPIHVFLRIASNAMTELYNDLRRGEDVVAQDAKKARKFAQRMKKKHGYAKWDFEQIYTYEARVSLSDPEVSETKTMPLTLGHIMSIYAHSKRKQSEDHMMQGGFRYDKSEEFRINGKPYKVSFSPKDGTYRINPIEVGKVLELIPVEYRDNVKAYVDDMVRYLTDICSKQGNEVSRLMWGIELFTEEEWYYPIKTSKDFRVEDKESAAVASLKNIGMSKATTPHAHNPIVLSDFDNVWNNHVAQMATYHGLVIPIDNMNKVLKNTSYNEKSDTMSCYTAIEEVYGEAATKYIDKLLIDLNGGVTTDAVTKIPIKLMGKMKKTAVAMSMSTVAQQPTAILRAWAMIDPKYFAGKPDKRKHSDKIDELQTFAPIAIIKEIGGFDTTSTRSVSTWIGAREYEKGDKIKAFFKDEAYRDEKFMAGAQRADEFGWLCIWSAVKREQAEKHADMDHSSDEFLQLCGERFSDIIVKTQVYDSTLSRSGLMRSKNDFAKMITSFMGEPTTSVNMVYTAILQASRSKSKESVKMAARTIGAVYLSIIAANAAKSVFYALRDDDEDESFVEKYLQAFFENITAGKGVWGTLLLGELSPVSMVPFVRDVALNARGFTTERQDMAIIIDIINAIKALDSDSKTAYRKLEDLSGSIAALFGIPLKNIMRTCREAYNAFKFAFDENLPDNIGDAIKEGWNGKGLKSEEERMNAAIINGKGKYKDNPTLITLYDLHQAALEKAEEINADDTLTDEEREDALGEVNANAVLFDFDPDKKWTLGDGSLLSKDKETTEQVKIMLQDLVLGTTKIVVESDEYAAGDTAERIDMVDNAHGAVRGFVKDTLEHYEDPDEAIDVIEDYLDAVESGEYDADVVDALASVELADGAPLVSNHTLASGYREVYNSVLAGLKLENTVLEYTENGEKKRIIVNRATAEELAIYEEKMAEKARKVCKELYGMAEPEELAELLDGQEPYQVYVMLKAKQ